MPGLLIELAISWLLLWFAYKTHLTALGILPTTSRMRDLVFGFFTAGICCALYFLSFTVLANNTWTLNESFTTRTFFKSTWWVLQSVLYEELMFRGALLFILIRLLNIKNACIISAIAFGIYHWFTMTGFTNPVQMAFIFLLTGTFGLMLAYAFAKTKSLYLPIGLHFGWNFVQTIIFSQGPIGPQILTIENQEPIGAFWSIIVMLVLQISATPVLTYLYLKHAEKNKLSPQA